MELYYELTNDGYHIYDMNDTLFHIHQYEPYIPGHSKSYEENAIAQIHELMVGHTLLLCITVKFHLKMFLRNAKQKLKR